MKDKVVELWINLCKRSFRPWDILSTYSVCTKTKQERLQHADFNLCNVTQSGLGVLQRNRDYH